MAEEQQTVRNVNWNEVFGFTQIFKSFKMAVHPSKLVLCLAALIVVFATGLVLDTIWRVGGGYVYPGEILNHATTPSAKFDRDKEKRRGRKQMREQAAELLATAQKQFKTLKDYEVDAIVDTGIDKPSEYLKSAFTERRDKEEKKLDKEKYQARTREKILSDDKDASGFDFLKEAEDLFDKEADKIDEILDDSYGEAKKKIQGALSGDDEDKALDRLKKHWRIAKRRLSILKWKRRMAVKKQRGEWISIAFLNYEWNCIRRAVAAVCYGNITTGLANYQRTAERRGVQPIAEPDSFAAPLAVAPADNPAGCLVWTLLAYRGVVWLIQEHWVYAAIYLLVAMCVCAVFGGAVNRIAALHFARDEKLSITQALRFSCAKFFSFFSAPLIPIGIILLLGVLIFLGALLMNIPWAGEIIVGVLFFLAILLGLAIAFLVIGFAGGAGLMYPTIAAEGSDSFDGISRSFTYVFTRPWRAAFYGLVALFYGVVTYLFVRLFAFLALSATHYFGGWGVFARGNELHPDANKLDVIWTAPTFGSLFGRFSWDAMSTMQSAGAFIIGIWVFLVAALVAAYMLSYCASATTVIYFLLRRKVDATDLDDVYVEETEQEPMIPAEEPAAEEEGEAETETPAEEEDKAEAEEPGKDEEESD